MNVLNLVTNPDAEFFEQQVDTLAGMGIDGDTVAVPGRRRTTDDAAESRTPLDYLRFYPRVLRASLDGYDVVHANYGLTAPAALAQPSRPVVVTLWGSDLLGDLGWLSRLCARAADAVIVMTDEMAAALGGVDSHVIPHGVNLRLFRPLPQAFARRAVGWNGAGRRVEGVTDGGPARDSARHDPARVLFPYATERPVKDYPRAESVVERARERLDRDVELRALHGVAHERMPLYLNAADALLLTSKREGSPNVVKEAMACNRPVVATDVGDVRTLLGDVTHSHVCRTDEQLVDGLVDVLDRGGPSDGRAHVRPYGLDRMGERIRDVYESVL